MTKIEYLTTANTILRLEVEALRSVLSEFEGDKSEYLQMNAADSLSGALEIVDLGYSHEVGR